MPRMHGRDFMKVLRKHWLLILLVTLGLGGVVAAASLLATPVYTARSSVFVSLPSGNTPGELSQGSTYTQGQMASFAELATSPVVLSGVIEDLRLDTTTTALARTIDARVTGDTVILEISAADPDPDNAAAIANAVVTNLNEAAQSVSPKRDDGKPTVEMTAVGEATPPLHPSSPNTRRNVAAGLFAGLLLGIAAAVVREKLDTRVRSLEDITARSSAPLLAEIADDGDIARGSLVMRDKPLSPLAESFRRLRTNLEFLRVGGQPISVVVTSSIAGEGKSTTTLNLAHACAQGGDRVLLVDADLRRPMVAERLGLAGGHGLTSVLTGRARFADVVQRIGRGPSFDVVTSGAVPPNPAELLGSDAMKAFVMEAMTHYDVVLFDAPPILPVVDAAVLGRHVTGEVVVVRLNTATKEAVERAMGSLDQVGAKVLGVVVNGVQPSAGSGYYHYYAEPSRDGDGARRSRSARAAQPQA